MYQSKSAKLLKSPYRFTHKITATESKTVEYDNGSTGTEQVETWSRPAAVYSTNMTSVAGLEGYDASYMFQFAVRKIANDPFDKFNFDASIILHVDDDKDTKYTIKNVQRATEPNGYHILTLSTHADSSTTGDSGSSGGYGY